MDNCGTYSDVVLPHVRGLWHRSRQSFHRLTLFEIFKTTFENACHYFLFIVEKVCLLDLEYPEEFCFNMTHRLTGSFTLRTLLFELDVNCTSFCVSSQ